MGMKQFSVKVENKKAKKPLFKRWWFWLVIVVAVIGLVTGDNSDITEDEIQSSEVSVTDEEIVVSDTPSVPQETKLSFTLTAGQAGEYGRLITYNKGTEFEESFYAYYVPAGTYTVTNVGNYMSQINIYSDEKTVTEEGWEEPKSLGPVKLLDVNKSATITVEEGQHIEIDEPSIFKLKQQ